MGVWYFCAGQWAEAIASQTAERGRDPSLRALAAMVTPAAAAAAPAAAPAAASSAGAPCK